MSKEVLTSHEDRSMVEQMSLDDIAPEVIKLSGKCTDFANRTLHVAAQCGFLLRTAKGQLERGEFDGWVESKCKMSRGTAYRYMRISSRWDELSAKANTKNLGVVEATELIAQTSEDSLDEYEGDDADEQRLSAVQCLSPKARENYHDGKLSLSDRELGKMAQLPHVDQDRVIKDVRDGTEKSFAHALGIKKRVRSKAQDGAIAAATAGNKKKAAERRKGKKGRNRDRIKDGNGDTIPTKIRGAFQTEKFDQLRKDVKSIRKRVQGLTGPLGQFLSIGEIDDLMEQVDSHIVNGTPAYICPCCKGEGGCDICRNVGWVPAFRYTEYTLK